MLLNISAKFSKTLSRKNLYEFLRIELEKLKDKSNILNIGSGGMVGQTIDSVCVKKHMNVVSMDITSERMPDIVGDICEMVFINEFDAIVMMEVLEHVQNPQLACRKVFEALCPGGVLIMSTPFIFPIHDRPNDYWRFTRYGLINILENAGFASVTVKERNGWGESLTVLLARVLNTPGHSRFARYSASLLCFLFFPVGVFLSLVWPHDFLTTGYTVAAIKRHG